MITLRTVGDAIVLLDTQPIGPDAHVLFASLVFLTAERGRHIPRERVSALLWPDAGPAVGRRLLRQLLYRLHKLGVAVEADRNHLLLPSTVVADGFAAAPSVSSLSAERAAGTLRFGRWLPDYTPVIGPTFSAWLDDQRVRVETEMCRAIATLMQLHRARGEWADVEDLAGWCLELDPLREEAVLARAEALAVRGARADALVLVDDYLGEFRPDDNRRRPAALLRQRIVERSAPSERPHSSEPEMIGRGRELALLTRALAGAGRHEGGLVLVWGPPGIGKSRLVRQVVDAAPIQRVRVLHVHCDEADPRRPLTLVASLLPALLDLPGALACSPDALALLQRFTTLDAGVDGHLVGRLRAAVAELVEAITGEVSLLVVIDDAHLMDDASLSVVRALHRRSATQSLVFVLTSPAAPADSRLASLAPSATCAHVALAPLADDDARVLLAQVAQARGAPWPAHWEQCCLDLGDGNPRLLRELALCCLEHDGLPEIPGSLQAVVDARIASLSPSARRALQAIAVLGARFTMARLDRMLEMPSYVLTDAIEELSRRRIVRDEGAGLRVRHELFAQRALGGLTAPALALMHRRAASVIERGDRDERTPCAKTQLACAYHWFCAGDVERTTQVLKSAVHRMIEDSHTLDAIRWLESAPDLGREVTDLARLLRQRTDAPPPPARFATRLLAPAER